MPLPRPIRRPRHALVPTASLFAWGLAASTALAAPDAGERARWQRHAAQVEITRDTWGIAHVHGRTDADAVFGMIYAQAEDDFNRIETNYLVNLGRLAEVEGETMLWQDLRQRLYYDPARLKADYQASPAWLQTLMQAWADGLNAYLAAHPQVKPRLLAHFEPWMALSFSEGSIGGDIERIALSQLQAFHERRPVAMALLEREPQLRLPSGSNGVAIAPSHSADGRALLLINPHTSYFFRSELQMRSDEGLNAYGAVTWGQFFVYQGFNRHAGWMHTSSGVDNVDEFVETLAPCADGSPCYRDGQTLRPLQQRQVTLSYRTAAGGQAQRGFTVWATHHGPIVRAQDATHWVAFAMMDRPVAALQQSFLRTKAGGFADFMKVAALQANSSNDTLYADADGTTAYLHPQFVPIRRAHVDYRKPVDGSDPATAWEGLHALDTLPQVVNPRNGWVYNANNWPWSAAGADSPNANDFPRYMDQAGENARAPHAIAVLSARPTFTPQQLIEAAYDPWLPAFDTLLPLLRHDYAGLPDGDARKAALAGPMAALAGWDRRWGLDSVPTTLAVTWADALLKEITPLARERDRGGVDAMATLATPEQRLAVLQAVVDQLQHDFGRWQVPWGEINRYQRNDGAIVQTFDDAKPSLPVPFTTSRWGSLASAESRTYPGTRLRYTTSGNSFVAVVAFGADGPQAWAVSVGGESGDPASPHFADQAPLHTTGRLRPVWFTEADVAAHAERRYRPEVPQG
ncbi:penicillin acylase family protein [Pseudoxanthomonas sp. X-1]|uniref:penicillin acylase family protein n=1 Tax=Pseudoxanthomonas sp. X-1 TaxID=2571115 RepID=UPI00110B26F4|nr:penicillin acylase family protein [Pseudoxanthomonas sp. X-1]TMN19485.1 acylase [Pseudoxanthomonas sp. X-1]UAY75478.1 penicillin acylase family protein [Pseudoxanthomonas sp. X-1]